MALGAQSFRVCHPQVRPVSGILRASGCRWMFLGYEKTLVTQMILKYFKAYWKARTKGGPFERFERKAHTSYLIGLDVSQVLCL